jgi:hypothetical protein
MAAISERSADSRRSVVGSNRDCIWGVPLIGSVNYRHGFYALRLGDSNRDALSAIPSLRRKGSKRRPSDALEGLQGPGSLWPVG